MRTLFTRALVALAITTVGAFGADNSIGTWKFNAEQSKYTPAPMPVKSLTVFREAADGGVKVTTTGERTDGSSINASYTAKYDGTEVAVIGSGAPYDTILIKQVSASSFTDERKKTGGPYASSGRTVISNGGNTMTWTSKGTGADGKPYTSTFVYEKQ